MSKRKPHADYAGYVAERRNIYSGGHTVILDCKRAASEGTPLVEDYRAEGGRYQVLCDEHSHLIYVTNIPVARELMKDPTVFCMVCRCIAGEGPEDWEQRAGLTSEEKAVVYGRRRLRDGRYTQVPKERKRMFRVTVTYPDGPPTEFTSSNPFELDLAAPRFQNFASIVFEEDGRCLAALYHWDRQPAARRRIRELFPASPEQHANITRLINMRGTVYYLPRGRATDGTLELVWTRKGPQGAAWDVQWWPGARALWRHLRAMVGTAAALELAQSIRLNRPAAGVHQAKGETNR